VRNGLFGVIDPMAAFIDHRIFQLASLRFNFVYADALEIVRY